MKLKKTLYGQGLMEYLLIAAIIAIVAVVALMFLTGRINQIVHTIGKTF